MVDVSSKEPTLRFARAEAVVRLSPETFRAVRAGQLRKGDVVAPARLAGILAAKKTSDLIPLCHPLAIEHVDVAVRLLPPRTVRITCDVSVRARTGAEMEAMTGCAVAALTVYDMAKGVERGIAVGPIRLLSKSGGRSGRFERRSDAAALYGTRGFWYPTRQQ